MSNYKFKEGDKVRVLDPRFASVKVGDEGIVDCPNDDTTPPVGVTFPNESYWWFYEDSLELIVEEEKTTPHSIKDEVIGSALNADFTSIAASLSAGADITVTHLGIDFAVKTGDDEFSTGTIPPNPKQLYGDKKLPFHLIPPAASAYIALGLRDGSNKYEPWNWRSDPVETMTYIGALKRHIDAWVDGEECASDSGLPHLAHAIAGLAILIDAVSGGFVSTDNRPPKGAVPKILIDNEVNNNEN
jgi:hypothetical protein